MDLTNINNLISNVDPLEMPVSELLTGSFVFSIPSYQRGYRWESSEPGTKNGDYKQVDDLLNDLTFFVSSTGKGNYYLQPLMVKPRQDASGAYVWDVLDGQQRLTTLLLILKCLNENLNVSSPYKLYTLTYENRKKLDFDRISYNPASSHYNFPDPSSDLDSYFVRKAKDRIERWYEEEVKPNQQLQDNLKKLLFYAEPTRESTSIAAAQSGSPDLRAIFIWYNAAPLSAASSNLNGNRLNDIEIFNRLNRGKIGLTDSELIKALFMLALKQGQDSGSSLLSRDTLVRKWDEMGKKFQDDEFWKMISPKNKEYSNRMDLLFDFIRECKGASSSAYRFYYEQMHDIISKKGDEAANTQKLEDLWKDVKHYFDTLCKWHENVKKHNYVGYLVENGKNIAYLYDKDLKELVKEDIGLTSADEIFDLRYSDGTDLKKIRKILLLFNVLTCDKYGQQFPFNLYRDNCFDVEHINSQTDNPIQKIDEKKIWIEEHAFSCLESDSKETDANGNLTHSAEEAQKLIEEGQQLLQHFADNDDIDRNEEFKPYREKVENFYAYDAEAKGVMDKDFIGNLTLLNSSINREYRNALFPRKLRTIKRSDQEGSYIPLCTKYAFLKYYTDPSGNPSAFSMMRWREADQNAYADAIRETLKTIF